MTSLLASTPSRIGWKADRSARYITLARVAIFWERFWPALWPASGIVGSYAALALLGVLAYLPSPLLAPMFLAVLAGTGYRLYLGFRTFRLPQWHEAARRLERDSRLVHRPLTEREDRLLAGKGDPVAEALWLVHLQRLLSGMVRLRLTLPSPGLPARDPYALRYLVLLLVAVGLVIAGPDRGKRLSLAFAPAGSAGLVNAQSDAWINPPAYTGLPPIYLRHAGAREITIPAGSELTVRVHSADARPTLTINPAPQGGSTSFGGSSGEYGAAAKLNDNSNVAIREMGRLLGQWRINVLPDHPPAISFIETPSKTERNSVKFAFAARDDYGVVSVRALLRPIRASSKSPAMLALDLPLSSSSGKDFRETVYRDLTGEPLAGLEVEITLEAKDGAGQVAFSKPVRFWLPARIFSNPLARALMEQRQNLAIAEPNARLRAMQVLDALTIAPEHFYANQAGVYLALRTAYWGLASARHADEIARVQDLLWQTAVALEDGGILSAAQELRELQQLLSQALSQGAPQNEIAALLQRYREALQRYFDALAQNAPQTNGPLPPNAKLLRAEDIDALLKAIEQMAQTGSREQAQQMLSMLQGLLENLHVSRGGAGEGGPDSKALGEAMQGLSDLIGKQRQLMDKSLREGQGAGDPGDGGSKGLAGQQGKLRDDLDKITKGLGAQKLPQPGSLGEAGRQMGNAQDQLGSGAFDSAGGSQKNALQALQESANALSQELMKRGGEGTRQQNGNDDPLGRAAGSRGGIAGGNVKIPDQSELARARAILEELRRRASEQGRRKDELDYIDRLLKQF